MKFILLIVTLIISCGTDKDDGGSTIANTTEEEHVEPYWLKNIWSDQFLWVDRTNKKYKLVVTGSYYKDGENHYVYEESSGSYTYDETNELSGMLTLQKPETSTCDNKADVKLAANFTSSWVKLGNDGDIFDVMDANTSGNTALEVFKQKNADAVAGCGYFKDNTFLPSGVEVLD